MNGKKKKSLVYDDDDEYESIIPEECRWRNWAEPDENGHALTGDELLDFVNNTLFPPPHSLLKRAAGKQGRARPRQQQTASGALEELRLQITPGLKTGRFETEPDDGAHVPQFFLRQEQRERVLRCANCNHIEN